MEELCAITLVAGQEKRVYYDIIGALPLELVLQIVEFLDEVDIVRSQRVSKRWCEIFSSNAIIRIILSRALATLGIESTDVAAANVTTYIRWAHNLQFDLPVKKVFLPWPNPLAFRRYRSVGYNSRRLYYVIHHGTEEAAAILDLETGKRSIWTDDAGRAIDHIYLSDRYLFMLTVDGVILERDIQTSSGWREKLFPRAIKRLTVEKGKLIILPGSLDGPRPLWIWDLHTDQAKTIGFFQHPDGSFWHMDADESVLVTCDINWDADPPLVHQTKWTLARWEVLDWKTFHLSLRGRRVSNNDIFKIHHRTYGRKTEAELQLRDGCTTLYLTYDHVVDRISVRWLDCAEPIKNHIGCPCYGIPLAPHIYYRWTSLRGGIAVCDAATDMVTVHPYQLDSREIYIRHRLSSPPPPSSDRDYFTSFIMSFCLVPFGDREVFGTASKDGMQLWFFNPDFVPDVPDAEPILAMEESG